MASGVHSRATFRPRFGAEGANPRRMFRPRGFTPPRRFPPPEVRGLVASRYRSWGSSCFRRRSPRFIEIRRSLAEPTVTFPATLVSYPSKNILDCSRTASPRPLPPGCSPAACAASVTYEALLRSRVGDAPPPLPTMLRLLPSWAWFPSKALAVPLGRGRTPKRSSVARIPPGVRDVDRPKPVRHAPGVCPEPKFASPKRRLPSWGF